MLDHSTKFKISIKITLNAISIYLCRIIRCGMHFANRRYTRHPAAQRFIAVHLFNELLNWNLNVFATCKLQSMQEFAIQWQLTKYIQCTVRTSYTSLQLSNKSEVYWIYLRNSNSIQHIFNIFRLWGISFVVSVDWNIINI